MVVKAHNDNGRGSKAVAVVGAAGNIGKKLISALVADSRFDKIIAIDRRFVYFESDKIEFHKVDVVRDCFSELLLECDSLVYLVEDSKRRSNLAVAVNAMRNTLQEMDKARCRHMVFLSSALVYGAYNNNPIPITEKHEPIPIFALAHNRVKMSLERTLNKWSEKSKGENTLCILRPTTTVSESMSWISESLRTATSIRGEDIDSPVQYLHIEDLISSLILATSQKLNSVYNVAADGWIGADAFRELSPDPEDKVLSGRLRAISSRLYDWFFKDKVSEELEPYIAHPWVIANDKLKSEGWNPQFSNEESYIIGEPIPKWQKFIKNNRQEVSLGFTGLVLISTLWGLVRFVRRFFLR